MKLFPFQRFFLLAFLPLLISCNHKNQPEGKKEELTGIHPDSVTAKVILKTDTDHTTLQADSSINKSGNSQFHDSLTIKAAFADTLIFLHLNKYGDSLKI